MDFKGGSNTEKLMAATKFYVPILKCTPNPWLARVVEILIQLIIYMDNILQVKENLTFQE